MPLSEREYRAQSLWLSQIPSLSPRPALKHDHSVDVAILGAGYTGLWSAYYLKSKRPDLRVAVFESEIAGFGASGRNGGWLLGELAGQDSFLSLVSAKERQQAHQLLHDIPSEVGRVILQEGVECDFVHSGALYIAARYDEQCRRLKQEHQDLQGLGYSEQDYVWLNAEETKSRVNIPSANAALFSPNVARIHPAKLARGLANDCEQLGVEIFEHSPVRAWSKGQVELLNGVKVKCEWLIPALEAYGVSIKDAPFSWKRYQRPVQSAIIATEPLSKTLWSDLGLQNYEVFSDFSRIVTYGQRTADDRLVFGARGAYLFGAALQHDPKLDRAAIDFRKGLLQTLFPQLEGVAITHAWRGNLALSRKFRPHMVLNQEHGFALSAAYGGDGVGASNLAGRTLSDLILGIDSVETNMPWVDKTGRFAKSKAWEPEPIPWLGYYALNAVSLYEDRLLSEGKADTFPRKVADKTYRFLEKKMA